MSIEILNKRKRYYEDIAVKFELLRAMKDREVIFMHRKENWKCIRGMFITNIRALDYYFNRFKFFDKDYNIYVSCSKYKSIPKFTDDLKERSSQTSKWFEKENQDSIIDYDILLDFDSGKVDNFTYMKSEVIKTGFFLIDNHINFNMYPSGSNYQIVIKNNQLFNLEEVLLFVTTLKKVLKLEYLDLKGIGVHNKIRKCEYSLVKDIVCLPQISVIDCNKTPYAFFDCNIILQKITLRRRGLKYLLDWKTEEENKNALKSLSTRLLI